MRLAKLYRKQPMALSTRVWQPEGHSLGKPKKRWYNKAARDSKPYRWPAVSFHGQSEGWKEHQLVRQ